MYFKLLVALLVIAKACVNSSTIDLESRIIGGFESGSANAPYIVSIRVKAQNSNAYRGHICGGALTAHTVVVTSASCLYNG